MIKRVTLAISRPLPVYPDQRGIACVEKLESDFRAARAKIVELTACQSRLGTSIWL
jgi:hypothetical protein